MAIWQIFMNWESISSSFFPIARCFTSQMDFQEHAQRFLGTWTGSLLAAAVLAAASLHILYNVWKIIRDFVLNSWSTKCSISENSVHYDRLVQWISKHPCSRSLTQFVAPNFDDAIEEPEAGVEFDRGQDILDVKQLLARTVSYHIARLTATDSSTEN